MAITRDEVPELNRRCMKAEAEAVVVTDAMIEAGQDAWIKVASLPGPAGNRRDAEVARYLAMRALEGCLRC